MKIKRVYIIWFLLITTYIVTRLINLRIIPIFTDEAIYTHWSQIALNDPANRFISLEDGKQPLFIWLSAIFHKLINDPLVASRAVSFFTGLGSTIGIFLLGRELFNKNVGILSSFLYIIVPFTLLYDRLALFDSLLTMLGIYSVLFTAKLIKKPALDTAFLTGFAIGGAMITKSSGNFFLYLIPFSLLLFDFKNKNSKSNFIKWVLLAFLVFIFTTLIFNSLRLSPLFYVIGRKNLEFIRQFSEVIKDPFLFSYSNLKALTGWIALYSTWPLFAIFLFGAVSGIIKKNRAILFLSVYFFAPFIAEVVFNKVLYPRFALFYFPFLLLIIAYTTINLAERFRMNTRHFVAAGIILLILPVFTSIKLLTKPQSAPIPEADSNQLFNDWPSGYGVEEIKEVIRSESASKKVYVGTQGTFGLLPFALQIYFQNNSNLEITGFWPVDQKDLPQQVMSKSKENKTYFVFNEYQGEITNPRLKLVSSYKKGTGNSFMRLYEVLPGE